MSAANDASMTPAEPAKPPYRLSEQDAADLNATVEMPDQPVYDWTGVGAPPPASAPLPPHRPWRFDPASAVLCERDKQPWPCTAVMAGGPWEQTPNAPERAE